MAASRITAWHWLRTGDEAFASMLGAIDVARSSIQLETYIFSNDEIGRTFLAALLRAQQRGVKVRVLADGIGSLGLPGDFFSTLTAAGGEAKIFNPLALKRATIRNHRKLLVCDDQLAFIGGFNISQEYAGDGVERGWRDLGLRFEGDLARDLAESFEVMFALADFRHKRLIRLRQAKQKRIPTSGREQLLLGGPGRGSNPIRKALYKDLQHARNTQIIEAYFLPMWRIRRALNRIARKGSEVKLILAGKSDVALSQLAARSLYRRLLKAGTQIYEYQPQILHAKLLIFDDALYVGSANLDPRSLSINYELMVRFENPQMVAEAREIFTDALKHSKVVELAAWKRSRTLWTRFKERCAYYFLARIDPHVARRQWKALPD
ncbi:MAG: phosphatidylserine/phosphatidylglycerophosphate/cardiolipin synthase family protein [Verrucomicrobiota bacterium]